MKNLYSLVQYRYSELEDHIMTKLIISLYFKLAHVISPDLEDLASMVQQINYSVDILFVVLCGALVVFMQVFQLSNLYFKPVVSIITYLTLKS